MGQPAFPAQRTGFRFRLPCHVTYCAGRRQGNARLVDISTSGCRLERVSHAAAPGSVVQVSIHLSDRVGLFDTELFVVRCTDEGFAGRFLVPDPQLSLRLLQVAKDQRKPTSVERAALEARRRFRSSRSAAR